MLTESAGAWLRRSDVVVEHAFHPLLPVPRLYMEALIGASDAGAVRPAGHGVHRHFSGFRARNRRPASAGHRRMYDRDMMTATLRRGISGPTGTFIGAGRSADRAGDFRKEA